MSLMGTDNCDGVAPPIALSIATTSFSVIFGIVTIIGNSLVLLAFLIDPNKNLRSPFNCFVANLAFADLAVGLLACPLSIHYHATEAMGKEKSHTLASVRHMVYFISFTASLMSMAALAVERYFAITFPMTYRARMKFRSVFPVFLGIWVVSIAFTFIYFKVGFNIYRFVFGNTAVLATFAVIIFTYVRIFKNLRVQVRRFDGIQGGNTSQRRALDREKHVTQTLLIILAVFIACYLPACVCIYIINMCSSCGCLFIHWARDVQLVVILANSVANPLVYGWRLRSFRQAFKRLLSCKHVTMTSPDVVEMQAH